jgi:hypothetical protein
MRGSCDSPFSICNLVRCAEATAFWNSAFSASLMLLALLIS